MHSAGDYPQRDWGLAARLRLIETRLAQVEEHLLSRMTTTGSAVEIDDNPNCYKGHWGCNCRRSDSDD